MNLKHIVLSHIAYIITKLLSRSHLTVSNLTVSLYENEDRICSICVTSRLCKKLYISSGLLNTIHIDGQAYNLEDIGSIEMIFTDLAHKIAKLIS